MSNGERQTKGRGRLFDNVVETVGDTPCIRINNLAPKHATIYVKAEFFNPAGSVKDRLALSIIETAEKNGTLKPGQTVVEATSGNTGIGLAMVCAAKGGSFPAYSLLIRLNYRPLQVLCQELNTLNRPSSWGIINSGRGYFEVHSNTAVSITG